MGANTTINANNESEFAHDFKGLETSLQMLLKLSGRWELQSQVSQAVNQEVREKNGQATTALLQLAYNPSSQNKIGLQTLGFKYGADSFPASESLAGLGLNRIGYMTSGVWENLKDGYNLKLSYLEAQPIFENTNQRRMNSILVFWETNYAAL
jgi:hypothetical protein